MDNSETTRITVKIRKDLKDKFLAWTKKFKISKDHFLRCQLPRELAYLRELPANLPIGRDINQLLGGGSERLNISLTKELAAEMDQLCSEKGIHREIFLTYYLEYLVNGDDEFDVESPLKRLEELLENPRLGYATKKYGNPYRHLYWEEESAQVYIRDFLSDVKKFKSKGEKS